VAQLVLEGRAGSPGIGTGRLLPIGAPIASRNGSSNGSGHAATDERQRLTLALEAAAQQLESLAAEVSARVNEEIGEIFEAQSMFARDPGIVEPALALIDGGVAADEAILRATDEQASRLASTDDDFFRERAADLRDVGRRVAALVRGQSPAELWRRDGHPAIVVADDLDPSAVATLRPELVGGIALAGGAPTGHAAIVARALGIPLVLGLGRAIDELAGDAEGVVDGSAGRLLVEPSAAELAELHLALQGSPISAATRAVVDRTTGVTITANVSSPREAEAAIAAGAAGIGLVRTELLFLGRHSPPTVAEQRAVYARIRAAMPGRPIVFRTLDVGGDKPAAWQTETEANPALGVRGLRLGLRRPDLLDDQLTALLEAAAGDELRVMLPMVSTREEVDRARERLDAIVGDLSERGSPTPTSVSLGVMIEVPSAAIMADALAETVDFFSIGTNDLVQYTLAADRTNPGLADLATAYQPAILRLIDTVARAAMARGRHVAVCGEAAADPVLVPLLIGLGVDELSVTPGSVPAIRTRADELDAERCRDLAALALAASTADQVREIAREASPDWAPALD
jgi:phosphoenolpyruvate-protein phosphotransferase